MVLPFSSAREIGQSTGHHSRVTSSVGATVWSTVSFDSVGVLSPPQEQRESTKRHTKSNKIIFFILSPKFDKLSHIYYKTKNWLLQGVIIWCIIHLYPPVAQLDNATDSDSGEREFKSLRAGQKTASHRDAVFLSKPQAWYIIRRRWYITKNGKAVFVSHHAIGVYKIFLRLDEIQFLAELMRYSPCGLMICNTPCWWYTILRLDLFTEIW